MDLILPLVDEIILMKGGNIVEHNPKDLVINGENIHKINVNYPVIYSIFNDLKKKELYNKNLPGSIPEAIEKLKNLI